MIIKNYNQLATSKLRRDLLGIIEAGLEKVSPGNLMKMAVKYDREFNGLIVNHTPFNLFRGRIFVIGGGKAAGAMAESFENIVGADNITAGAVNCLAGEYSTKKIKLTVAGHPLPDDRGVAGVEKMLALKDKYNIGEKDLVVCLLSGGGSALMSSPVSQFSIKDQRVATEMLIKSGANIKEINIVRKHLSKIKGGQLAKFFEPAPVLSIIISDVVGDKPDTIASGPTEADLSTFAEAYAILEKYNLLDKVPASIKEHLVRGCRGEEEETPKKLTNAYNFIIGDSAIALEAMTRAAKSFGYSPIIVDTHIVGDPAEVSLAIAKKFIQGDFEGYNVMLFAGEMTPIVPEGHGRGGRNQHFTALNMLTLKDLTNDWGMASFSSDGVDYIAETAGAIIDNKSLITVNQLGLDINKYIKSFDTYHLFEKMGSNLITTGQTGTNVGDLFIYIIK